MHLNTSVISMYAHVCGQAVLVCGHSLEVNATSDIDFFVSLEQVALAERVLSSNIHALVTLLRSLTHSAASPQQHTSVVKHAVSAQQFLHVSYVAILTTCWRQLSAVT